MKSVRIFFLLYDYLPAFRPDVTVLFGRELPRLGVNSDLMGQVSEEFTSNASWGGGRFMPQGRKRKGLVGEFIRPFQDLLGFRHLRPEHQIIQVRDKIRTGVLAWLMARLTGRQMVYWMSFPYADGYVLRARELGRSRGLVVWLANWARAWLAGRVFYGFLARRVDHLFVQSDEMLRMMHGRGKVHLAKMTAVPMGVDDGWLARDRAQTAGVRPAVLQGRRVLAYIGTLSRSRQPEFLIQVFEKVHAAEPDALLLLIGDAPSPDEQTWLRGVIAASPAAASIHLSGWLPPEDGQRWLAHADLGLSPIPRGPLFDVGSPTKAIEYLALGVPCVGNDNPDQAWVLEQSAAGICVPMERTAFAEACLRILRDPALARDMGARGPGWVRTHRSYSVLAPQVAAAYRRLVTP